MTMTRPQFLTFDGVTFRDLNHNGRLDPFEDPRLDVDERVEDLVARLGVEELAGLMFHTVIEAGPGGELLAGPGQISKTGSRDVVVGKLMNHFNVHALVDARHAATWANRLQELACETPHSIPVTISTDPRHAAAQNAGTSWASVFFSQWPDALGLAALGDPELVRSFADVVRREYVAVGIRQALHPTADLATEPRWGRQRETFGQDHDLVARLTVAAIEGLQGERLGPRSVSATTKHFPGAGPQAGGEDAHFPYGRDQVYPGGRFDEHLRPFEAAIAAGTAAIMPYYGRPVGLVLDGEPVEEVGFGYNRQVLTDLLRERLGYDGVILSDWELVNDNSVGDQVLPARAWGVEHLGPQERMLKLLDAGIDQFGGEECVDLLLALVADGRVTRERLEASARRLLRVKLELGLFDDPFVDADAAEALVGTPMAVELGLRTQARSVVVCADDAGLLPLRPGTRVWLEGVAADAAGEALRVVDRPEEADVALIRLPAPFEPRDDLFLESWFHQGSLDFPPGLPHRLRRLPCPLLVDVMADRPAVLTPLLEVASALTVSFGVSDTAWLLAMTGQVPPEGRLPMSFPESMDAVRAAREDVAGDAKPLFPAGHSVPRTRDPRRRPETDEGPNPPMPEPQ
ncbi:glycoside hydrolase family 3 protein [Tessaracoccus sp. OS52]|uniref:glycoside hydrolase family 3 protein n=1 Tax=Tessaracoccus sp. OS52 TaxID=2886691 RepID=UPI001D0FFF45|nr:glycoside hydrolase family 3 N-terminal domain-containing protein [Tessaracoccus sp. OS52]MCC2594681.1 glycoside hydrolase family 3 protein [Tessaracoccus sp. OS52]